VELYNLAEDLGENKDLSEESLLMDGGLQKVRKELVLI